MIPFLPIYNSLLVILIAHSQAIYKSKPEVPYMNKNCTFLNNPINGRFKAIFGDFLARRLSPLGWTFVELISA